MGAYLCGGGYEEVIHTVVNALVIVSDMVWAVEIPLVKQMTLYAFVQHIDIRNITCQNMTMVREGDTKGANDFKRDDKVLLDKTEVSVYE